MTTPFAPATHADVTTEINRLRGVVGDARPGVASTALYQSFVVPATSTWTDVPSMQISIPAGVPVTLRVTSVLSLVTTATPPAAPAAVQLQMRVVDAASASVLYAYSSWAPVPTVASATYANALVLTALLDPFASATVLKLQANGTTNAGVSAYNIVAATPALPSSTLEAMSR